MGQSIFGGSSQSSNSGNSAFPFIMSNYGASGANAFNGGVNMLGNILGVGGSSGGGSPGYTVDMTHDGIPGNAAAARAGGQPTTYTVGATNGGGANPGAGQAALQNYFNSAGGQFQLGQGMSALTNKFAAEGLSKSGAAMKGMETFRQGLASTYLNNYLGQLGDLAKLGLGAGGLVSDAGQYSSGSGSSSPGIAGFLGSLISAGAMASDPRLKTNIELIRRARDGLGWHRWNWRQDPHGEKVEGVLSTEVEKLRPWAFARNFRGDGFDGVNYALLGSLN